MRGTKDAGVLEQRLEAARRAVADWRRHRRRGVRMPEPLWEEAVALARRLGVYRVSQFVDVGYGSLKSRLGEGQGSKSTGVALPGTFVELEGAQLLGEVGTSPWTPRSDAGIVVELSSGDGAHMMVRLGAGTAVDVVGLARAFWSRGR